MGTRTWLPNCCRSRQTGYHAAVTIGSSLKNSRSRNRLSHLGHMFTVQKDALPDFKVDQEPQTIAVFGDAGAVLVCEAAHRIDVEQSAVERARRKDQLADNRPTLPSKP